MSARPAVLLLAALPIVAVPAVCLSAAPADQVAVEDNQIADSLAAMLRAARAVISVSQARINDPTLGPKGLDGKTVLAATIASYRAAVGIDLLASNPKSRHGFLVHALMDAIVAVVDNAQRRLDTPGVGFKGFIPAVFGRLVSEEFARRASGKATIKVTAPPELVRNRAARPDAFESQVISEKFLAPDWPRGTPYSATVARGDATAFRVMVPEYYVASCLTCHGQPVGSLDMTGYPREGRREGDLGGVISITLLH